MNSTPINLKRIDSFNWVVPAHDTEIEKQLAHYGSIDIEMFQQRIPELPSLLHNATVLDVGAYTGDTAHTFRKLGARKIYAIEPYFDAFCALCINLPWPDVIRINLPVGDGRRVSLLQGDSVYAGMRWVIPSDQADIPGGDIASLRLDDLSITGCDFLKIDVEGFEPAVLDGAQKLIAQYRPVILIEAFPDCLKRFGWTIEDIKNQIGPHGYIITTVGEENSVRWDYLCKPN